MRIVLLLGFLFWLPPTWAWAGADSGIVIDAGVSSVEIVTANVPSAEKAIVDARIAPDAGATQQLRVSQRTLKQDWSGRMMGLIGCLFILLMGWLFSLNRNKIPWRLVGMGTALQLFFAFIVLKTKAGLAFFEVANDVVRKLLSFSDEGARFIFGNLIQNNVGVGRPLFEPATMSPLQPDGSFAAVGAMFAFGVLPTIIFFSAMTAALYHLNILPRLVKVMAWLMQKTMRTSGAESLSASANIFVGQTEAPLMIRPFLKEMTSSELMAVMTGGFATVAGGVMAAYVGMLSGIFPDIAGHLIAASVMSAPASLVLAKMMVPETEIPTTMNSDDVVVEKQDANVLAAISRGTTEGLTLALNVGAMLIAFIAIVAMLNWTLGALGALMGFEDLTFQVVLGWILGPLAWMLGVPWEDANVIGAMLGTKPLLMNSVAYMELADGLKNGSIQHAKSVVIATYALCGFANFSSIGIQIGGLSAIEPSRRGDLGRLGLRAMIAATLACFQTAAIAGMLL